MQEALRRDVPALHAAFEAFNSWLDDDWGFDRGDGRLYAAPMIALADPDRAAAEVERVLGMGARILVTIPGPVPDGNDGYVSPGHPQLDKVWALIAESGVPMALHAGPQRREPLRLASGGPAAAAAAAGSRPSSTRCSRWSRSPTAASPTRSPP